MGFPVALKKKTHDRTNQARGIEPIFLPIATNPLLMPLPTFLMELVNVTAPIVT